MAKEYTLDELYAQIDAWMAHWRAAHPEDAREELEIFMSEDYRSDSPSWPEEEENSRHAK